MPLPTPNSGESQSDFLSRCIPVARQEAESNEQAVAICHSQWDRRSMNDQLLKAIRARTQKRTEFGYGITTADRYVRTLEECIGNRACYKFAATKQTSWNDVVTKSRSKLVYGNPEMRLVGVPQKVTQGTVWTRAEGDPQQVELPKNTLMAFRHVLTTPRKDRDGDILRTQGAQVDPNMLLLWQHVHTLPIGKMVAIATHDAQKLVLISTIVDMNELAHDAAVMIDNQMGRFSHGFRALEFETLKEDEGDTTGPGGYDIKQFEIMEESLVSVPSNVDAEVEEVILSLVEGERLTSGIMKEYGRQIRERRPASSAVTYSQKTGDVETTLTVGSPADFDQVFGAYIKDREAEENGNANQPGGRSPATGTAGERSACTCSPSEKEGSAEEEKEANREAAGTDPQELGPSEKRYYGPLEGSWEWTEGKLRDDAKPYLERSSIAMSERFAWLVGTFADNAVICAEHRESGVRDEFLYYEATWQLEEKEPKFFGEPKSVDLVTTTEIRERSPLFPQKSGNPSTSTQQEKAGRVLSQRNLRKLEDVKADLEEMAGGDYLSSRAGTAMCERCISKLGEVISEAGSGDNEASHQNTQQKLTVREAIGLFLTSATAEEREELRGWLSALASIEHSHQQAQDYRALVEQGS